MKLIPKFPYIINIYNYYCQLHPGNKLLNARHYLTWVKQFGFQVPIRGEYLEFSEDFSEAKLTAFILKWS